MRRFILGCLLSSALLFGSRTFTSTSNLLLAGAGVSLPATGSISLAINPTYMASDGIEHAIFEVNGPGSVLFRIYKFSDNTLYFQYINAASTVYAANITSFLWNMGSWQTITATWTNGGLLTLSIGGMWSANSVSFGALSWSPTTTTWSIGNVTTGGNDFRGSVALAGVWNRALSSDEILALSLLCPPSSVAPSGIIHEWDMAGTSLTDSIGSITLASTGTTTSSDPSESLSSVCSGSAGPSNKGAFQ